MYKLKSILFSVLFVLAIKVYSQDHELKVYPKNNQTVEEQRQDEDQCAVYADDQSKGGKHTTLKNTGIGAGIGVIGGKILGKPLAGAAIGGAAGAYRGHKKSQKDRDAFDQTYASCLQEKGYNLDIQPRDGNKNKNNDRSSNDQYQQNNQRDEEYTKDQQYDNDRYNQYDRDQQYDQRRNDQYQHQQDRDNQQYQDNNY